MQDGECMTRKRIVSIWVVAFSCLICVDSHAQGLDRIFYSTFSPQGWDIYLSLDNGETTRKIAEHSSLDYEAAMSPDGRWIVFTSERSGMSQFYALPIDDLDSDPRPLFVTGSFQDQATFSPDGLSPSRATATTKSSHIRSFRSPVSGVATSMW